jgi:hypothetical protein
MRTSGEKEGGEASSFVPVVIVYEFGKEKLL